MFPKKLITAGALSLFLPLMFMRVAAGQELEPLEYAESFDDGIPVTWTIIDGYEDGISWEWYDPVDDPIGAPFTMPSIIMDSLISSNLMDEIIISPGYDLSRCQGAITLQFANCFMYYALNLHEIGDVDVSADGGATWTNVLRMYNNHFGPEIRQLDVTSIASGATDFKTRFHYYNARQEYWWFVDDVKVSCMATPEEPEMTLDCDGFAEPMHQVVTIKGRRPILPLKATLTDSETGVVITDVDLENPPV
ncbi:MAG: hypothetical protein HKP16_03040, partial [Xanthomonadales bacterium]|nr:hypothetical protein [Xanthomonadales bacterium]